jgi:elongation factor P
MMDKTSYEQIEIPEAMLEDVRLFLRENMDIDILMDGDKPLTIELPNFVEMEIKESEPGVRGDTAQGASKPARLESGLVVQVPLFVNQGDVIRVDTRTGKYVTRV